MKHKSIELEEAQKIQDSLIKSADLNNNKTSLED